jgi:cell division protein FtsL
MENSDLQNILGELTNANLVVLGLSISIFTVIYSFLVNKKNDLNKLTEKINNNQVNPFDNQQRYFALKYIKQFSKVNEKLLYIILATTVLFIAIFVFNRFLFDAVGYYKVFLFYSFIVLTAVSLFYFLYIFFDLIKRYKEELTL